MLNYSKFLREHEVLIGAVRPVWWSYAGRGCVVSVLVLLVSLASVPLLSGHLIGRVVFFLLTGVALWRTASLWYVWAHDVLLLTDQRVIDVDQRGIFSRTVTDAPYMRVLDITWNQLGIVENITRCGGITITTASGSGAIEIRPIAHPKRVQELIRDLAEIASRENVVHVSDRKNKSLAQSKNLVTQDS